MNLIEVERSPLDQRSTPKHRNPPRPRCQQSTPRGLQRAKKLLQQPNGCGKHEYKSLPPAFLCGQDLLVGSEIRGAEVVVPQI